MTGALPTSSHSYKSQPLSYGCDECRYCLGAAMPGRVHCADASLAGQLGTTERRLGGLLLAGAHHPAVDAAGCTLFQRAEGWCARFQANVDTEHTRALTRPALQPLLIRKGPYRPSPTNREAPSRQGAFGQTDAGSKHASTLHDKQADPVWARELSENPSGAAGNEPRLVWKPT